MRPKLLTGEVLHGINNIYDVESSGRRLQCRIKGKVLKVEKNVYNPIAVGDLVDLEPDPLSQEIGWIVKRQPRRSSLARWNKKRKNVQVIAANAELLVCVSSVQSPPFRPRFLDRVLVSARDGNLEPVIAVNKCDLGMSPETSERIENYRSIGYRVILSSAVSGRGMRELKQAIRNKPAIFFGQSGAGKSTLLNRMFPGLNLAVGDISSKYDRGTHTTNFARLIRIEGGYAVIDTPGIREFAIAGIEPRELSFYFPDLSRFSPGCSFSGCGHVDEPECAVRLAVERGEIHPDRYESYLRIYYDVEIFARTFYG